MENAVRLFRDTFGTAPEGVWEAPGRVNLIGEHTDYNAGLVLPIALPQRTYAAARRRDDRLLRLVSMVAAAFDFEVAYREIGPALSVLELFHGPSLSFKDFGVRFLAQVLARLGPRTWRR